jgi:hypothetical protein
MWLLSLNIQNRLRRRLGAGPMLPPRRYGVNTYLCVFVGLLPRARASAGGLLDESQWQRRQLSGQSNQFLHVSK